MKNIGLRVVLFSLFPLTAFAAEECTVTPECAAIGFPYTAAECGQKSKLKCPFGEGYFCSSCDISQGYYDECPEYATCSSSRNANGCYTISYCNGAKGYSPEGDGEWDTHQSTGVEYPIVRRYGNNVYEEICLKTAGCRDDAVTKEQWDSEYKDWFAVNDYMTLGGLTCYNTYSCNNAKGYYSECPSNMTSLGTKTFPTGLTCHKCRCNSGYNPNNEDYEKIRNATDGHMSNGCYIPDECQESNNWIGDSNGGRIGEDGETYWYEDKARELYEIDDTAWSCYHAVGCLNGLNGDEEGVIHDEGPGQLGEMDEIECYTVKGCDTANGWYSSADLKHRDAFNYTKTVTGNDGYNGTYSCTKVDGCSATASANPGTSSPFIWEKYESANHTCYVQQACNATQGYYPLTGGPNIWYCPNGSTTTSSVTPATSPSPYFHCGKCQGTNFGTKTCTAAGFYASQADCIDYGENNCRKVYGTNCWAPIGTQCAANRQTLYNNGLKGYVYDNLYAGVLDLTDADPCPNGCGLNEGYMDSSQKPLIECDEDGKQQCRNRYHANIQCSENVPSWNPKWNTPVKFKKVCSGSTCCASIDWSDIQTKMTQCRNAGGNFENLYIEKNNPIDVNSLSQ